MSETMPPMNLLNPLNPINSTNATNSTTRTQQRLRCGQAVGHRTGHKWWVVVVACMALLALGACGTPQPPSPDWQVQARDASQRATAAHLSGHPRVAQAEWQRARQEVARTAQPDQVGRVILAQCALRQAGLEVGDCAELKPLLPDLSPALRAYHRYLLAQVQAPDVALLPVAHQPVAQRLLGQGGGDGGGDVALVVSRVQDPLARLVAASVVLRHGQASPVLLALAVDTASAQAWSRPLLAWLGAHLQWAEQAGQMSLMQQLQRRIHLLSPAAVPSPTQ